MKFNVPSKTLYNCASAVSKVINSKNALTILNNFLFELNGNVLTITASDVENRLVSHVEVMDAEGEGCFCVDARRIVELLKEMPDQGITFEINDDNLSVEINYSSGNSSLIAINGNEFPANEAESGAENAISFTCPTEQILKGIENTMFAVGNDELRPQMMGILWDIKPDGIVLLPQTPENWSSTPILCRPPKRKGHSYCRLNRQTLLKTCLQKTMKYRFTLPTKALLSNRLHTNSTAGS